MLNSPELSAAELSVADLRRNGLHEVPGLPHTLTVNLTIFEQREDARRIASIPKSEMGEEIVRYPDDEEFLEAFGSDPIPAGITSRNWHLGESSTDKKATS